ncbi:transcriptional regulator, LacI family [Microbacterium sp. cf046]|uniref:LacI family DNA-binding transcriptional regulator n=1 Tax=Microbacterium sp. cf046 TaxID=1761803 RepID=UPI0008EDE320|nr:LacI family DNA-binding transcriptional regulator [Microbacterium sp. cf046]SFS08907.1 transcriptional regulator, LacI family [Microbacterium sp. cf046]
MADEASASDGRVPKRARGGTAPTIYDIARLAEVNPSTVSRALSQPGRINAKTEERIRAAAKELDYRVNPIARALPTGRTNTLGLVVADITNPVIFGIVRGAERAAAEAGYTLIVAESQESGEREATAVDRVIPSVDGLVLATTRLGDAQISKIAERKPLVVINRAVEGQTSILPDVERGVDQLVAHLSGLGHRSIAYLSGPDTSWISARRWEALMAAAPKRAMSIVEIGPGAPTLEGGVEAITRVVASGVSAVVAFNDLMAIGLLRAAVERGIVVPDALSIAGFDDIFGSDFTTPGITTVRAPLAEAGERAVRHLLDRVGAQPAEPEHDLEELLPTDLVVRGSTGPPPA